MNQSQKIIKKLQDKEFFDCKINYKCCDNEGILNCHRVILSICPYFDKYFKSLNDI